MKKLISMTSYVLWISEEPITEIHDWRAKRFYKIRSYAQLLQTPLSLSMFIPCNKDGEPMERKDQGRHFVGTGLKGATFDVEYHKAMDSVLFEGWEFGSNGFLCNQLGGSIGLLTDNGFKFYHNDGKLNWETIEDIIKDFTLTLINPL